MVKSLLTIILILFFFNNIESQTLKVVVIEENPFTIINNSKSGNDRFSGFSIDFMNVIATRLGFNFTIYEVADKQYGAKKNNIWNGMVGDILYGSADLAFAPLTITSSRSEVINFIPYSNIGLRAMVKRPEKQLELDSFLKPFQITVWFSVIGIIILVGLLLWIYDVISPYGFSKTEEYKTLLNFGNSLYNSGVGMTGQLGNPGRTWATRALTLGYYLFLIIVTTTYTANLTANLTTQSGSLPITKIEDTKSGIILGTVSNSAPASYFDTHPSVGYIKQYLVFYPTYSSLIEALKVGNVTAIIWDTPILDFTSNSIGCEFVQIGDVFDPSNYGIGIPKNSSYYEKIEVEILKAREDGTIDKLYDKWLKTSICPSIEENSTSMGLDTFGGVFIAFGILVIFCTFIIFIEIIFHLIYQKFGEKFPILLPIHIFFGGIKNYIDENDTKNPLSNSFFIEKDEGCNVEIYLSCKSLIKKEYNPMIICYHMERGTWKEIGRTEILKNMNEPSFKKSIPIFFKFEEKQELKFILLDINFKKEIDIDSQKEIGVVFCKIGDIVGSRNGTLSKNLIKSKNLKKTKGIMILRSEGDSEGSLQYFVQLSGRKLDNFLGLLDPFIVISKMNSDETFSPIKKTEIKKFTINPKWKTFTVDYRTLCSNDPKKPIKFDVYDWNYSGNHVFIGSVETNFKSLSKKSTYEIINVEKTKNIKRYKNSGLLDIILQPNYIFFDYLQLGLEISLIVAIDFSISDNLKKNNRFLNERFPPKKENKLSKLLSTVDNSEEYDQYEESLLTVAAVLDSYDSDHKYPVFGFGSKDSDCFACNENEDEPDVHGIDGILEVYKNMSQKVIPKKQSNFSEVIKRTMKYANDPNDKSYNILLILTDGIISDMKDTIKEIVDGSHLPLSIVILGIGNHDFKNMIYLDGDKKKLSTKEKISERDIVQFVSFNKYKRDKKKLATAILQEIPQQVEEYMYLNNLEPKDFLREMNENDIDITKLEEDLAQFEMSDEEIDEKK